MTSGGHTKDAYLLALADRVEKLTGPDRNLDLEICLATSIICESVVPGQVTNLTIDPDDPLWVLYSYDGEECTDEPPSFTASLDAAMTLVPEEWRYGFEQTGVADHVQKPMAWCWPFASSWEPDWQLGYDSYKCHDQGAQSLGETPALALTAACLRALAKSREAQAGGGE